MVFNSAAYERPLRVSNLLTTALATPLLIATTVVSLRRNRYYYDYRNVTAFCFGYIPLALTVLASSLCLVHQKKHGKPPGGRFYFVDGLALMAYLGVLIPIWVVEIRELRNPGSGLLVGYTTAPMIVNMIVHGYMFCTAPSVLAAFGGPQMHQCPNCHSSFTTGASQVQETIQGGETYTLLRGEGYLDVDADAEHYSDAQTGAADEQIRPEDQSKEKNKKAIIEV